MWPLQFETNVAEIFFVPSISEIDWNQWGVWNLLDDVVYQIEDQFVASKQAMRYLSATRIYAKNMMLPNFQNEHFKPTENTDKVLPESLLGFASVTLLCTLIKKKIKFSSYIRKFRRDRLQSHIWLKRSHHHIWLNIYAFTHILGSPSSYMTLQLIPSQFPNIWG